MLVFCCFGGKKNACRESREIVEEFKEAYGRGVREGHQEDRKRQKWLKEGGNGVRSGCGARVLGYTQMPSIPQRSPTYLLGGEIRLKPYNVSL